MAEEIKRESKSLAEQLEDELFDKIFENEPSMNYDQLYKLKLTVDRHIDERLEIKATTEGAERVHDTPLKALADFNKLYKIFDNTHKHLAAFELVDHELALKGDAYYPIKKVMCYMVESLRQNTIKFWVGSEMGDNRIHVAEMVSGGRGKTTQRKLMSQYNVGDYKSVPTFQPTRTHVEQLIGRTIPGKGKTPPTEKRGFFGYKGLVVDECQTFICEEEKSLAALMLDFRNAMEVYGKNTVEKKLVAENLMRYEPETRFLFLMHPIKLPALFFDHGTARRLFMFKIDVQPIPESAAFASILNPMPTSVLRDYINNPNPSQNVNFNEDAKKELVEWIQVWTHYVLTHPNQRVRAIGQRHFTSVKMQFIRMVAILSMARQEITVTRETVAQASLDCIHFLLCTYEIYANESTLNLSRDVWKTTDPKVAMVFEWMHYNGATSEATTRLSINDVELRIAEVFGIQDRQAIGIFNTLVEQGLMGKKKGQHDSKAWLGFTPELEGGVTLDVQNVPDITKFMEDKISHYQLRGARPVIGKPTLSRDAETSKISSVDNLGVGSTHPVTTLAPLKPKNHETTTKGAKGGTPCDPQPCPECTKTMEEYFEWGTRRMCWRCFEGVRNPGTKPDQVE